MAKAGVEGVGSRGGGGRKCRWKILVASLANTGMNGGKGVWGEAWQKIGGKEETEAGMFTFWLPSHRVTQAGCTPQLKVPAPRKMTLST